jgi:hypothetical protein
VRKKLRRKTRGINRNRLNSQWRSNVSVPSRKVRRGGERYLPLEPSAGSMLGNLICRCLRFQLQPLVLLLEKVSKIRRMEEGKISESI